MRKYLGCTASHQRDIVTTLIDNRLASLDFPVEHIAEWLAQLVTVWEFGIRDLSPSIITLLLISPPENTLAKIPRLWSLLSCNEILDKLLFAHCRE